MTTKPKPVTLFGRTQGKSAIMSKTVMAAKLRGERVLVLRPQVVIDVEPEPEVAQWKRLGKLMGKEGKR